MPRLGTRKLYYLLADDLQSLPKTVGRDKLFAILRKHRYLILRKKSFVKTTNSAHRYKTYKNLIKNVPIINPDQVWVSDITYIRTEKGFVYLYILTDLYSRKIVGYNLTKKLSSQGTLKALEMAVLNTPYCKNVIHHSDRGAQYACKDYTTELNRLGFSISMTEEDHVYENSVAERINGILKDEFYLDRRFPSFETAISASFEAIKIYNSIRPHLSLKVHTPDQLYAA